MVEEQPSEEILSLSNDALPSECPVLHATSDSENYGALFSPFETPPNKYLSIYPPPGAPDESLEKQDVSDPLTFAEGSPVTPQLQESSILLPEIDIENQEYHASIEAKLYSQTDEENHFLERSFVATNVYNRTDGQVEHGQSMETDFQELLELGKAMNLPSGPGVCTFAFSQVEGGATPEKEDEKSDNNALLPFPLDDIFTSLPTEEQNCANRNTFSLTPSVTHSCPNSSTAIVNDEIVTSRQILASQQQYNAKSTNIDDVLHEVAHRNTRRYKRVMAVKGTQGDATAMESATKKRKVTPSSGDNNRKGDNMCSTSHTTSQGKKPSKKGQRSSRMALKITEKAQTPPGSTPSRFCHICTRAAKPDVILVCGNVARGTCRKIICFKCIRDMSWDWGSLQGSDPWTCTHCREDCPAKAQCHTYRRVNQNRRADGRRSRKTTNATSTKLVESNNHVSNG